MRWKKQKDIKTKDIYIINLAIYTLWCDFVENMNETGSLRAKKVGFIPKYRLWCGRNGPIRNQQQRSGIVKSKCVSMVYIKAVENLKQYKMAPGQRLKHVYFFWWLRYTAKFTNFSWYNCGIKWLGSALIKETMTRAWRKKKYQIQFVVVTDLFAHNSTIAWNMYFMSPSSNINIALTSFFCHQVATESIETAERGKRGSLSFPNITIYVYCF